MSGTGELFEILRHGIGQELRAEFLGIDQGCSPKARGDQRSNAAASARREQFAEQAGAIVCQRRYVLSAIAAADACGIRRARTARRSRCRRWQRAGCPSRRAFRTRRYAQVRVHRRRRARAPQLFILHRPLARSARRFRPAAGSWRPWRARARWSRCRHARAR